MRKFFDWAWANKQAITGAVTGSLSALAAANMMSADLVVKITAVTGALTMLLGLVYSYINRAAVPTVDTARSSP